MYRSYREYLAHPTYREACRAVAVRSGGMCEADGCTNKAKDVHHTRYCKWGEFDPPENLMHLCRDCHEKAHTCARCGGVLKSDAIKAKSRLCATCRQRTTE